MITVGSQAASADSLPYDDICSALSHQGYVVLPAMIPEAVTAELTAASQSDAYRWSNAGIGRGGDEHLNPFVRRDRITWLDPQVEALGQWFALMRELRLAINRRLFLGLWDFESHLSYYAEGAFYKAHYDAFRGRSNRKVSMVTYLNSGWVPADGGQLVLYPRGQGGEGVRVAPLMGTMVLFLSEEMLHEVLPTVRPRYSVAGWFRVNDNTRHHLDPAR